MHASPLLSSLHVRMPRHELTFLFDAIVTDNLCMCVITTGNKMIRNYSTRSHYSSTVIHWLSTIADIVCWLIGLLWLSTIAYMRLQFLQNLPLPFCKAIGFRQRCMITLKTSTSSTKSWQACLNLYQNCGQLVGGWKSFCLDNGIRVGDVCTMEIIETTLWNVTVDRREDRTR